MGTHGLQLFSAPRKESPGAPGLAACCPCGHQRLCCVSCRTGRGGLGGGGVWLTVPTSPPALPSAIHPRLAPGHAAVTALPGFQHHLWLWGPAREGCSCVNLSPQGLSGDRTPA